MSTRDIVHWQCRSPEHRALLSRHGRGGLTIHEGAWAYCDAAGADEAHEWAPTGGVSLESLIRWTAPKGGGVSEDRAPAGSPTETPKRAKKLSEAGRT